MFAFDLPRFAALSVSLPTGGGTMMIHVGGGRFIAKVPPLVLAGVSPAAAGVGDTEGLPIEWDGTTLPGDGESRASFFAFDVAAAQRSVEEAAAGGDTFAQKILEELARAEEVLAARAALGVMAPAAEGATAEDDRPSDAVPVSEAKGD